MFTHTKTRPSGKQSEWSHHSVLGGFKRVGDDGIDHAGREGRAQHVGEWVHDAEFPPVDGAELVVRAHLHGAHQHGTVHERPAAAEERFGIKIPDDQVSGMLTVGDAVNFIVKAAN